MLSQQLAKGWEYLAQNVVLLPGPYPGCILFFTVAAENKAASVFYVRATTLESAWREGATRVRQWAWARQRDDVELRIDWVQDITPLKTGSPPPGEVQAGALALADAGLERAELWPRPRADPPPPTPCPTGAGDGGVAAPLLSPACLLLHLRGIFISGAQPALPVPRTAMPPPPQGLQAWTHEVPVPAAVDLLLERQRDDGGWPGADAACDHLGVTYALLQAQRHAGSPALAQAIARALDHLDRHGARLPPGSLARAMALLVLARHAGHTGKPGPAAGFHARAQILQRMDQQADSLLSWAGARHPAPGTPEHLELAWAELALHAYVHQRCGTEEAPALRAARSALPPGMGLPAAFIDAALQDHPLAADAGPGVRWIGLALAESIALDMDLYVQPAQTLQQWRSNLQRHLQSLRWHPVWPEQALHLPPPQRRQAAFMEAGSGQVLSDPCETARLLLTRLAGLELLGRLNQALQPAASTATLEEAGSDGHDPAGSGPAHRHLPLRWEAGALASAMQGRWLNQPARAATAACMGVDASRQHHLPGAAMLVRRTGQPFGVPSAALQSVRASALISSMPHGLFQHGLPILHVPDMHKGLRLLARAARQRIRAPVVVVTGCAGKSSTLGMLRQCLQGAEDARADALLSQGTPLQMINWSETTPCALLELPLQSLASDLPLAAPDILVITNISFGDIPALGHSLQDETYKDSPSAPLNEIVSAMQLMHKGACLVINHATGKDPAIMRAAQRYGIRLITFGTHLQADVHETAFHGGTLQVQIEQCPLAIDLQSDGHHMALNAQAALATLLALGLPLRKAAGRLADWMPHSGTGQPQLLPNGIRLLDHSMSNHLLSMSAAFSQLHLHARQAESRLIVLAGVQSHAASLDSAQLALEPLVRGAQARRVLLYGEALRQLAAALGDLLHVNWYDDLNQLIGSLLRTMHEGDTVLLAGRATANLAIAADAIRDSGSGNQEIPIGT